MTTGDDIARQLRDFLQPEGFEIAESDYIFADRIMPLVRRAQAEAWERGAIDALAIDEPHNPYIEKEGAGA